MLPAEQKFLLRRSQPELVAEGVIVSAHSDQQVKRRVVLKPVVLIFEGFPRLRGAAPVYERDRN